MNEQQLKQTMATHPNRTLSFYATEIGLTMNETSVLMLDLMAAGEAIKNRQHRGLPTYQLVEADTEKGRAA